MQVVRHADIGNETPRSSDSAYYMQNIQTDVEVLNAAAGESAPEATPEPELPLTGVTPGSGGDPVAVPEAAGEEMKDATPPRTPSKLQPDAPRRVSPKSKSSGEPEASSAAEAAGILAKDYDVDLSPDSHMKDMDSPVSLDMTKLKISEQGASRSTFKVQSLSEAESQWTDAMIQKEVASGRLQREEPASSTANPLVCAMPGSGSGIATGEGTAIPDPMNISGDANVENESPPRGSRNKPLKKKRDISSDHLRRVRNQDQDEIRQPNTDQLMISPTVSGTILADAVAKVSKKLDRPSENFREYIRRADPVAASELAYQNVTDDMLRMLWMREDQVWFPTGDTDDETIRDYDSGPGEFGRHSYDPYFYQIEPNMESVPFRRRMKFKLSKKDVGLGESFRYQFVPEADTDDDGYVKQTSFMQGRRREKELTGKSALAYPKKDTGATAELVAKIKEQDAAKKLQLTEEEKTHLADQQIATGVVPDFDAIGNPKNYADVLVSSETLPVETPGRIKDISTAASDFEETLLSNQEAIEMFLTFSKLSDNVPGGTMSLLLSIEGHGRWQDTMFMLQDRELYCHTCLSQVTVSDGKPFIICSLAPVEPAASTTALLAFAVAPTAVVLALVSVPPT